MELFAVLLSFWVLYPGTAFVVLMLAFVAHELPGRYFTLTLLVFAVILQFLARIPIFGFIAAHPLLTLLTAAGYFIFGVLYTRYYKLPYFCRKVVEAYEEARREFFTNWERSSPGSSHERTVTEAWHDRCRHFFPEFRDGEFSISSYKGKLITWITYWPWFLVWSLVHDLVKEIGEFIYLKFRDMFQRVAARIYQNILQELSSGDKKPKE